MIKRSYYSSNHQGFIQDDPGNILGELLQNDPYSTLQTQKNAWLTQIQILQKELIPIRSNPGITRRVLRLMGTG